MKIEIEGADELVRSITKRVGRDRVNGVIRKNTIDAQRRMMRNATFVKGYQTGFTKRSISFNLLPLELVGEVGPGSDYSVYLEYGTRYMDAQPFVIPTRNEQAPIFLRDMKNLIRKG